MQKQKEYISLDDLFDQLRSERDEWDDDPVIKMLTDSNMDMMKSILLKEQKKTIKNGKNNISNSLTLILITFATVIQTIVI